jgi:hypothetical protein
VIVLDGSVDMKMRRVSGRAKAKVDRGVEKVPLRPMPERAAGQVVKRLDPEKFMALLKDVATNAWKAQVRLSNEAEDAKPPIHRRLERNMEAIIASLSEFGVRIKDHTGDAYDYGQLIKVVATQPQAGLLREVVTETLRPTIHWDDQLIQQGEVVIAIPETGQG